LNCDPDGACYIPDKYQVYRVSEYGNLNTVEEIQQELYQRGPISCGVYADDVLHNYQGGIINDPRGPMNHTNHAITLTGWGVEDGTPYWIIQNSWGISYGEEGFFRIIRGVNNLAIESNCHFAVPINPDTDPEFNYTTPEEQEITKTETEATFLPKEKKNRCRKHDESY
jgi:cathepsin X